AGLLPCPVLFVRATFGLNPDKGSYFLAGLELKKIGDTAPLRGAPHVRDFVDSLDIDAACVREEHQEIVRSGGEQVLDEILVLLGRAFAGDHANNAFAAAPLGAIGTDIGALDQAIMG